MKHKTQQEAQLLLW